MMLFYFFIMPWSTSSKLKMDSDFDESLNDFKKPRKKLKSVERKTSAAAGKKGATRKVAKKGSVNKCSTRQNAKISPSEEDASDAVSATLAPLPVPLGNFGKEDVQLLEDTSCCPTCGKLFDVIELTKHVTACLRANFEACKSASTSVKPSQKGENGQKKIVKKFSDVSTGNAVAVCHGKLFFCPTCALDLSVLSIVNRNTHINRCIDSFIETNSQTETSSHRMRMKIPPKTKARKEAEPYRCPLCLKALASNNGYKRHLKSCQAKHKFSTMTALALHRPNNEDHVDDELLAEIRRVESRPPPSEVEHPKEGQLKPKKGVKKPKVNNKKSPEEDMLQLAIAVSKNEDLEKKRPRKRKQKESIIPLMISVSPNSKRQQLQARLHSIARPEELSGDKDLPSTPALPATSLKLPSNVHVVSHRQERDLANKEACSGGDNPGSSGLGNRKQLSDIQKVETRSASVAKIATIQETDKSVTSALLNSHDTELQSPEVSSSNLERHEHRKTSVIENHNLLNQDRQVQFTDVAGPRQLVFKENESEAPGRKSHWTLATSSELDRSSHRVRGLLSQFDREKENSLEPKSDFQSSSNEHIGGESLHANLVADNNDNIDSTLLALEALDKNEECRSPPAAVTSENSSKLQSPQGSPMSRLINNSQFSDARILAGKSEEPIKLHRSIVFCSCPRLLDEILKSEKNVLHLPEFTKAEIMPVIDYIYSLNIESLLVAEQTDKKAFSKTLQLVKRFDVSITEDNKKLLDSKLGTRMNDLGLGPKMKSSVENLSQKSSEVESMAKTDSKCIPGTHFTIIQQSPEDQFAEDELYAGLTQPDPPSPKAPATMDTQLSNSLQVITPQNMQSSTSPTENMGQFEEIPSDCDLFDCDTLLLSTGNSSDSNCPSLLSQKDKPVPQKGGAELDKNPVGLDMFYADDVDNSVGVDSDAPILAGNCLNVEPGVSNAAEHAEPFSDYHNENTSTDFSFSSELLATSFQNDSSCSNSSDNTSCTKPARSRRPIVRRSKRRSSSSSGHGWKYVRCRCCSADNPHAENRQSKAGRGLSISNQLEEIRKETSQHGSTLHCSSALFPDKRLKDLGSAQGALSRLSEQRCSRSSKFFNMPDNAKNFTSNSALSKTKLAKVPIESDTASFAEAVRKSSLNRSSSKMVYVKERMRRFKDTERVTSKPDVAKILKKPSPIIKMKPSQKKVKAVKAPAKRRSMSQPVPSKQLFSDEGLEQHPQRKYKFRKMKLVGYASPSTLPSTSNHTLRGCPGGMDTSSRGEISGYGSDGDVFDSILFNDSFEQQCLNTPNRCLTRAQRKFSTPKISEIPRAAAKKNSALKTGPVPITPMPNFGDMETPEVLKRASKIGLKKALGKQKLKTKLVEEYLYKHQIVPESDESCDCFEENLEEDDFCINTLEMSKIKLRLSRLSASPGINRAPSNLYSFSELTHQEVLKLSSKVVDTMYADGTLLSALKGLKEETGSIKRGSLQDQQRCWNSVTLGSSSYDPKLNAILCLSEEYQSAITAPLVACVVKHYIDYKKQQFNCLPVICDRMEQYQKDNSAY